MNPEDKDASPLGWHDQRDEQFITTIGNNVYAQVCLQLFTLRDSPNIVKS